jgi:hypothetical protein
MKRIFFIYLFIGTLFSCSREFDYDQFPQKWQLTKMTGQISESGVSGSDMDWQESYLLNSNGTFIKSRERNGILTEVSGTFTFKDLWDGKYLELNYESGNALIGSCYSEPKELLWVRSESRMDGTWSYCDGPGLEYERVR